MPEAPRFIFPRVHHKICLGPPALLNLWYLIFPMSLVSRLPGWPPEAFWCLRHHGSPRCTGRLHLTLPPSSSHSSVSDLLSFYV